jgi:divalent metal cation (Fe/Co/Zn/Cd) transporter
MLTENDYIVIAEVEVEDSLSLAKMEELSREIENRVKKAVPEVRFFAVEFVARRNEPPTYRRLLDLIGKGS